MAEAWYKKATVQAALVSGIPAFITAIIAIIAIVTTSTNSNKQLGLIEKQYQRDSIYSSLQIQFLIKQIDISKRSFLIDSISYARQLQIAKTQIDLSTKEAKTQFEINKAKLDNTIDNILSEMSIGNVNVQSKLPIEQKIKLIDAIYALAIGEINNPIIVNDEKFQSNWEYLLFYCRLCKKKPEIMLYDFGESLWVAFYPLLDMFSWTWNVPKKVKNPDSTLIK